VIGTDSTDCAQTHEPSVGGVGVNTVQGNLDSVFEVVGLSTVVDVTENCTKMK
jgi:hypothetical protein